MCEEESKGYMHNIHAAIEEKKEDVSQVDVTLGPLEMVSRLPP